MISRIRNYFCTVDPISLTFAIVLGSILLGEAIWIGLGKFLLIALAGLIMCALVFAIGFVIYKTIVWAQSHCP